MLHHLVQVLFHRLHQRTLRNSPNHSIHLHSILEHHHRGNTTNAILCRHLRTLIRIQLHSPKLISILGRQLVDNRRNHSTRPTPRRPEINQHRHRRLQHNLLPRRVVHRTYTDRYQRSRSTYMIMDGDITSPPRVDGTIITTIIESSRTCATTPLGPYTQTTRKAPLRNTTED